MGLLKLPASNESIARCTRHCTSVLAFPSVLCLALDSQLCRKPHSRREIPSQSQLPAVYVFRARQVAGRDIKILQKRASRARARVYPRVFVSVAVHAARIIPGEFLRGVPCGAFESVHARASPLPGFLLLLPRWKYNESY